MPLFSQFSYSDSTYESCVSEKQIVPEVFVDVKLNRLGDIDLKTGTIFADFDVHFSTDPPQFKNTINNTASKLNLTNIDSKLHSINFELDKQLKTNEMNLQDYLSEYLKSPDATMEIIRVCFEEDGKVITHSLFKPSANLYGGDFVVIDSFTFNGTEQDRDNLTDDIVDALSEFEFEWENIQDQDVYDELDEVSEEKINHFHYFPRNDNDEFPFEVTNSVEEKKSITINDSLEYEERIKSSLTTSMDYRAFPFEEINTKISIEPRNNLKIKFMNFSDDSIFRLTDKFESEVIGSLTRVTTISTTNYTEGYEFSKYETIITIEPHYVSSILKYILPVVIVAISMGIGFYVQTNIRDKVLSATASLVGAVVFHGLILSTIPSLPYFTFFDIMMIGFYFIHVIVIGSLLKRKNDIQTNDQNKSEHSKHDSSISSTPI